jgi:hypothetical protein
VRYLNCFAKNLSLSTYRKTRRTLTNFHAPSGWFPKKWRVAFLTHPRLQTSFYLLFGNSIRAFQVDVSFRECMGQIMMPILESLKLSLIPGSQERLDAFEIAPRLVHVNLVR